jgi:hypothetical protein
MLYHIYPNQNITSLEPYERLFYSRLDSEYHTEHFSIKITPV